jgi:hypothetical protein
MPLFQLSVRHGRTREEACSRLEYAVDEVRRRFGPLAQGFAWSPGRDTVTITGAVFRVEMRVDAEEIHVKGDIPLIGALAGTRLEAGLRQIVNRTFGKG